jgi:hypothetical protein
MTKRDPLHSLKTPLSSTALAAACTVVSLLLTVGVTGLIARKHSVFTASQMLQRLHVLARSDRALKQELQIRKDLERQEKATRFQLDRIRVVSAPQTYETLIKAVSYFSEEKEKHPRVFPFITSPALHVFPSLLTCLLWLVLVFPPKWRSHKLGVWDGWFATLLISTCPFALYTWSSFARNHGLFGDERIIYSYANRDIDVHSYRWQIAMIVVISIVAARLWQLWAAEVSYLRDRAVARRLHEPLSVVIERCLRGVEIDKLSRSFNLWQIRSAVLGIGFLFFSHFIWIVVIQYGDRRYLFDAISVHSMWAITWLLISIPLLQQWHAWNKERHLVIAALITSDIPGVKSEEALDLLKAQAPLSMTAVTGSAVLALCGFLYPLFQVVLH